MQSIASADFCQFVVGMRQGEEIQVGMQALVGELVVDVAGNEGQCPFGREALLHFCHCERLFRLYQRELEQALPDVAAAATVE